MKKNNLVLFLSILLIFHLDLRVSYAQKTSIEETIKISMQFREPSKMEEGAYIITQNVQAWKPSETAVIICDMWDQHWCAGASSRVKEMAPKMNEVISTARKKGLMIVHAPSDCMDYYENHPARKLGKKHKNKKAINLISTDKLESEKDAVWPVDQSNGGCDCSTKCKPGNPWKHQTDLISISDKDAISDAGQEITGLFEKKGIKNVILMGVHTNMCVIGRSFGLRSLVRAGLNVALMRDMTDTMYDSGQWPNVNHYTGNSLVNEYIETYVCPSIVSSAFTGKDQFRFNDDNRPVVAFIIAEDEYRSEQRLPEFAHKLMTDKNINCEFAVGIPTVEGEGVHNIENLQVVNDADLIVISVRRRALVAEQMNLIKNYVSSGKPVLAYRTSSHGFSVSGQGHASTLKDQGVVALEQWREFDQDVLGGNYKGHYGQIQRSSTVNVIPGMESHILLKGVDPEGFHSPSWLYRNSPLRSDNIQVLLYGSIPGKPSEPVLWVNNRAEGKTIYTSLGHYDDWKIESFTNIMLNSVEYLLNYKNQ
jgi:nicotinamidase-related amidase/type 1 glutamine amidotransferase